MEQLKEARAFIRAHETVVATKAITNARIKKLWATGCITQRQLAKLFSYSQSNISRIISEG